MKTIHDTIDPDLTMSDIIDNNNNDNNDNKNVDTSDTSETSDNTTKTQEDNIYFLEIPFNKLEDFIDKRNRLNRQEIG